MRLYPAALIAAALAGVVFLSGQSSPVPVQAQALTFVSAKAALPTVDVPAELKVRVNRLSPPLPVKFTGSWLKWDVCPSTDLEILREYDPDPKVYRLRLILYADAGGKATQARVTFTSGDATGYGEGTCIVSIDGPGPKPPDPPIPPDPPVPPTPQGFRVLLVYESSQVMTKEQQAVLYSPKIAEYLTRKCVKDGQQPSWRRWDKDVNTDKETEALKKLWAAAKPLITSTPCLVVSVNEKGEVLPFPASEQAALDLLKKKGGE